MILLAIEVVLIFTFTSSDNFTLLFYNLISFVLIYDPVYQNDTPERILQTAIVWADGTYWSATAEQMPNIILYNIRGTTGRNRADWKTQSQRPVLYLNNL